MAIKTQLRTAQLTGSYGTATGLINDQGSAVATGSAAAADMGAILSQMASAIKRINGSDSFSEANAGVFTHATSAFSGKITVLGDTAAADKAALGYTAAEGVILTGQGSTSDVTLKNDADAVVLSIATGTTNVDIVGDAAAANFKPDGDTSASDAAAVGYTAAEGIIVTGQGSTSDVTIKNDADATVLSIPTGTTNVDVVGDLSAAVFMPDGDTSAGDAAAVGYTAADGLILAGQGSTNDVSIKNDLDVNVIAIPTGGTDVTFAGDITVQGGKVTLSNGAIVDSETAGKLKLTEDLVECSADLTVLGNDLDFAAGNANIGASVGANALSLGGAASTAAAPNDLQVNGNILADANEAEAIFSAVTSADITIGNGATIVIPGNLTVNGTTTTIDTTNLLVKDPVIQLAHGAQSLNTNQGLLFGSGSATAARPDVAFGRVANDTWGIGSIANPDSGSITTVAGMTMDVGMRAAVFEVAGATNTIDVSATNLRMVAAADIILDPAGGDVSVDGNVSPLASNGGALGAVGAQWSDLFLAEGGVINFDNGDMTLTQAGNLLTVAGGELRMNGAQKVEFGGANDYINLDTDLKVVAAADVVLRAGGDSIRLKGSGTNQMIRFERANATSAYMNFTADDSSAGPTGGSGGFGFRNSAGTMQFKNNGGSWTNFGSSTNEVAAKANKEMTAALAGGNRVFGAGNGLDISSFGGAEDNGRIDLFVNGQLMLSGGAVGSITKDYALDVASGRGDVDVQLNFALVADDVVTLSVK